MPTYQAKPVKVKAIQLLDPEEAFGHCIDPDEYEEKADAYCEALAGILHVEYPTFKHTTDGGMFVELGAGQYAEKGQYIVDLGPVGLFSFLADDFEAAYELVPE